MGLGTCLLLVIFLSSAANATPPASFGDALNTDSDLANGQGQDITFLIDDSDRVPRREFIKAKNFVKDFITKVGVSKGNNGTRVAVLNFVSEHRNFLPSDGFRSFPPRDVATLHRLVDSVRYKGGRKTIYQTLKFYQDIILPFNHVHRASAKQYLFILSDGEPRRVRGNPIQVARDLKRNMGVDIFGIKIGAAEDMMSTRTLTDISSEGDINTDPNSPKQRFFKLRMYSTFGELKDIILLDWKAQNTDSDLSNGQDITFLLDDSESVSPGEFIYAKNFVKYFIWEVGVSKWNNGTRVAVLNFASEERDFHQPDGYHTYPPEDVTTILRLVDTIQYKGGWKPIHQTLKFYQRNIFPLNKFHRESAKQYLFILSDGEPRGDPITVARELKRDMGVDIFCIKIGRAVSWRQDRYSTYRLTSISSERDMNTDPNIPRQRFFKLQMCSTFGELEDVILLNLS